MGDVLPSTIEKTLPPLDAVMVWHKYLLNPMYVNRTIFQACFPRFLISWYAEDIMRVQTLSSLPHYTAYLTSHLASTHFHLRCLR